MTRENSNNKTKKKGFGDCSHETAESLGSDNGMGFLRCLACQAVIVSQGGIHLAIPPVRKAG